VKRNIERVNGRIEIDTVLGKGTTFTLRIPLTLAIIEGMLVRVGTSHYTIPLLTIKESVKATRTNLTITSEGQQLLRLRNRHFPIVRLEDPEHTGARLGEIDQGILVLVESGSKVACVLVDEVIGQRQTVIKPLPPYLRGVENLSGCSILHNGDISLIVDIDALVRATSQRSAA
jgi:two-component system, chemotaxis family, sensor kinase CheA